MSGSLALVGGGEFTDGCTFDADLLAEAGGGPVVVLPTAAAFEHPERAVATAEKWFARLGGAVTGLMVLRRPDALDPANAAAVRAARFLYLTGGSPMHLRSVLKETPVWDALVEAWHGGAVLAASSAGAMALCDPMVDPRGGAFTLGLGLLGPLAVIAHHDRWTHDRSRRTYELAGSGLVVAGIDERTALVRNPEGRWHEAGAGHVTVMVDGQPVGLDRLP